MDLCICIHISRLPPFDIAALKALKTAALIYVGKFVKKALHEVFNENVFNCSNVYLQVESDIQIRIRDGQIWNSDKV